MIGEISIRYRMVLNNLGNLTNSVLTNTIRIEFQDYFGKANIYSIYKVNKARPSYLLITLPVIITGNNISVIATIAGP